MQMIAQTDERESKVKVVEPTLHKALKVPDGLLAEGFQHIMRDVLNHITENIEAARNGDPEGIHQLRVGIRRTRAALRMFREKLPATFVRRYDKRLQRFGIAIGEARDWDVFVNSTLDDTWPDAAKIRERAIKHQARSHRHVEQILADRQLTRLLTRIRQWAESEGLEKISMRVATPDLLDGLVKTVRNRRREVVKNDTMTLHDLRKATKRLRYGVEFTGSLYKRKRVKRYVKTLRTSLDQLGAINDLVVTQGLIEKLGAKKALRNWTAARRRAALQQAPQAIAALKQKAFWRN